MRLTRFRCLIYAAIAGCLLLAGGCVYRIDVQQGNLLEETDIAAVKPGMTRSQVRFLLGTPMVDDPFHKDRWDYVYFIRIGRDPATFKRWVTIVFEDDIVVAINDDQELDPNL